VLKAWLGERARTLADVSRSITLIETISRVENDLAETLRRIAARDGAEAAARRLRLAEDAARGAQAAARASERLRRQSRQLSQRAELITLHEVLSHATAVLADLDRAESDLAEVLTALADCSDPDLAAQWRQLAAEASAAAQHARDRAHALRQLAQTDTARTQPGGRPAADTPDIPPRLLPSRHQRLAGIDRRLAELQQAKLRPPGGDTAPPAAGDAPHRARESAAHLRQTRQLAVQALRRAATAHDQAARVDERSARAGIGDVAEHKRKAAFHRAAARADRQRAQELHSQVADSESSA